MAVELTNGVLLSAMLPARLDGILLDGLIACEERHVFDACLGYQEAVKWGLVQHRQMIANRRV